jgi:peptidoglycan/xylan/chitin deacetylase (PgdA/CDA1 family)
VLDVALPILERYRCPFKVYLTEADVGARLNWLNKLSWLIAMAPLSALFELAHAALTEPPDRPPLVSDFLFGFVSGRTAEAVEAAYAARRPASEPRLYLDDAEVRRLSAHPLVELGSHSVHHYPLTRLGADELRDEVVGGHERLLARFPNIVGFAVPFGFDTHVTPAVAQAARAVDSALVTAYGGPMRGAALEGIPEIRRTPVFGNLGSLWYAMTRAS